MIAVVCSSAFRPSVPDESVVYAIGDIHGCRCALETLHRLIARHVSLLQPKNIYMIYLGDYIDRGPDSRGVIDLLLAPHPLAAPQTTRIFLMGNHEAAMCNFLADPDHHGAWLDHGGLETLASYGVRVQGAGRDWRRRLAEDLREKLPDSHRRFLESLVRQCIVGDYLFVHAGINPARALDAQNPEDLLWIREPFLSSRRRHKKCIVHGHTPVPEVQRLGNRIAVDTGAYLSGRLSCAVLVADAQDYLSTVPSDSF